jgi:hypothetical protein
VSKLAVPGTISMVAAASMAWRWWSVRQRFSDITWAASHSRNLPAHHHGDRWRWHRDGAQSQFQAALSLGLSNADAKTMVMLPQAMRSMMSSLVNQAVFMVKATSVESPLGSQSSSTSPRSIPLRSRVRFGAWEGFGSWASDANARSSGQTPLEVNPQRPRILGVIGLHEDVEEKRDNNRGSYNWPKALQGYQAVQIAHGAWLRRSVLRVNVSAALPTGQRRSQWQSLHSIATTYPQTLLTPTVRKPAWRTRHW